MTGPAVDPGQMKLAATVVLDISQGVRDKIAFIRNTVETPGNWTGATRRAVLEQMQRQLPTLNRLSDALEKGSGVLTGNMSRFGMEDETAAADVGKAAGQGAGAPATGSIGEALKA